MMLAARCGCTKTVPMLDRQFHRCEDHGEAFVHPSRLKPPKQKPATKPRKSLKRTRRRETPLERKARDHFNATVKGWPCWFKRHRPCRACGGSGEVDTQLEGEYATAICAGCGGDGRHHCDGEKDAHHVIPKQFIRRMFQAVLPEPEFVAILFNPAIGAPLCRYNAHEPIEKGNDRIYWEDLSPECVEYVFSLPDFMAVELERKCPKREPSPSEVSAA